jgi:hypothetical protein
MTDDPVAYQSRRLNNLAAAAFLVVIACALVAVFVTNINEYAKGIITFLLGRFSGYVDNVYSFEFGTTRGSKAKDDVITNLASASPNAPSVIAAAEVAAAAAVPPVVPVPPPVNPLPTGVARP